jgi:hypothetical protein
VPTSYYLVISAMLFTIGVLGVLVRRNAIIIFMCVEMMLNAGQPGFRGRRARPQDDERSGLCLFCDGGRCG